MMTKDRKEARLLYTGELSRNSVTAVVYNNYKKIITKQNKTKQKQTHTYTKELVNTKNLFNYSKKKKIVKK